MHARRVLAEKSEQMSTTVTTTGLHKRQRAHGELKLWLETSVSITLANSMSKKPFIWLAWFLNEIEPEILRLASLSHAARARLDLRTIILFFVPTFGPSFGHGH